MLMRAPAENLDDYPEHVREKVAAMLTLSREIASTCDAVAPDGDAALVLNALMSAYVNAAVGFGCCRQAAHALRSGAAVLELRALLTPSAASPHATHRPH